MADDTGAGPDARAVLARGLRNALAAHHEGRILEVDAGWDDAAAVDHDDYRISIALNLWEDWAFAAEHWWDPWHPGVSKDDWPRFANLVIDALEHDREIEDPSILEYFVRKPRSPSTLSRLIARIKARLFRPGPSP